MGEFILWLLITLLLTGGVTICGYKTKEAWDKWRHAAPLLQTKIVQQNLEDGSKIDVAKLKIKRAFEDFNKIIIDIDKGFPKESETIAAQFNARGTIASGMHIKAQMDLSLNTKRKLDEEYEKLKRKIEDILIEVVGKISLDSAGAEFGAEQKLLDEAKKQCVTIYPLLNDTPKSWEQKALNQVQLTKDFDVVNGSKN